VDGGFAQPALDRIRGSVRRIGRGFRHPVQRPYRSERFKTYDLRLALQQAAERSAVPLSLAAMEPAAGFLSFLPTDYKAFRNSGRSPGGDARRLPDQHHRAAGLLRLLNPPGKEIRSAMRSWRRVDYFLERHRFIIIFGTLLIAVAGRRCSIFCSSISTRSICAVPRVESIATFLDLRKDPNTGANASM